MMFTALVTLALTIAVLAAWSLVLRSVEEEPRTGVAIVKTAGRTRSQWPVPGGMPGQDPEAVSASRTGK